ncbi:MAG: phosphate acyltransferase [Thermodesulfobacteriota bacterium]|nr:phosphate acyltransferase [Thermodesulfobacteriota bacterium]
MRSRFQEIMEMAGQKEKLSIVISGKRNPEALSAILTARDQGWIDPVAYGGPLSELRDKMDVHFVDYNTLQARQEALRLLEEGGAEALLDMGPLDSGFFSLLIKSNAQIKKNHLLSYVSVFMTPKDGRLTLLTDTLINSAPGVNEKVHIVENAIHVAKSLRIDRPKIAALAPLELVNPEIPSTLDAAILSKMSKRSQFGDAIVEGPLAMDNAESALAARHKGIDSPVPGNVDIYLFPDLESANITAQFLKYLGSCQLGGVLAGTKLPIIIRSSLESPDSWLLNIALGLIVNRGI